MECSYDEFFDVLTSRCECVFYHTWVEPHTSHWWHLIAVLVVLPRTETPGKVTYLHFLTPLESSFMENENLLPVVILSHFLTTNSGRWLIS